MDRAFSRIEAAPRIARQRNNFELYPHAHNTIVGMTDSTDVSGVLDDVTLARDDNVSLRS
jgi:hypothetical protein